MSGKRLTLTKLSNGAEVELVKTVTMIGRQYDCDIQLTEGYPSRKHAQLIIQQDDQQDAVYIEDLRSANGTYVNGARITTRVRLSGGDRIRFHIEEFKFNTDVAFADAPSEPVQPPNEATIWASPSSQAAPSPPQATVLNVSDAGPTLGGMKSLFSPQNVASEALQSMSADQAVPNVQTIPSNERVNGGDSSGDSSGDSTIVERLAPVSGVQTVFRKAEEPTPPVASPAPIVEPASASRTIFRSVPDTGVRTPPPPEQPPVRSEGQQRPEVARSEVRDNGSPSHQYAAVAPEAPVASALPQPATRAPSREAGAVPPSAAGMAAEAIVATQATGTEEEPIIAERLSLRAQAGWRTEGVEGSENVAEPVARPTPTAVFRPSQSRAASGSQAETAAVAAEVVAASGDGARRPGAWADPAAFSSDANRTKFIDPAALKALVAEGPSLGVLAGAGSVSSPHLFVASGSQTGTKFKLLAGPSGRQEWTIGSEPGREVVLSDSGVSALHAKLINEGQRWKLIDQMSANGTFVNSKRSNVSFLAAGDRVRFGPVECVFQAPRAGVDVEGVFSSPRNKLVAAAVGGVVVVATCLFIFL